LQSSSAKPVETAGDVPAPVVSARDARLFTQLDVRLAELRRKLGIPGVSATIIFPDGLTWTGVDGMADVAGRVPVRPGTPFALASISKTFTAALILQLIGEGRLALGTSAAAILPALGLDPRITIRELLDHTSGLPDFFLNPKIEAALDARRDQAWTSAESLSYVGPAAYPPGVHFHYSNTNYLVLGLIAEHLTGDSVAAELRRRFIDPLGLTTVVYQGEEAPHMAVARAYRFSSASATAPAIDVGDGSAVVPFPSLVSASGAAGSLAASSGDVASWARDLYASDVLAPGLRALMIADANRTSAVDPTFRYGLGVETLAIGGHRTLGHDGRYIGVEDAVRYFLDAGLTIAVMTNQDRASPGLVVRALLAIATTRGAEPPPPAAVVGWPLSVRKPS
jgi:D-alanyl-D-alanine carboxypeptidase